MAEKKKDKKIIFIIIGIAVLLLISGKINFGSLKPSDVQFGGAGGGGITNSPSNTNNQESGISCTAPLGQAKAPINTNQECYAFASEDCIKKGKVTDTFNLNGVCCTYTCKTLPPSTCTDSDNGLNFDIAGTCISSFSQNPYADYCWPGTSEVYEFTCDNTKNCLGTKHVCENGCLNGACLPTSHCASACQMIQGNYKGGLCVSYNQIGAMSTNQRCVQSGGTYEVNAQACGVNDICCCI